MPWKLCAAKILELRNTTKMGVYMQRSCIVLFLIAILLVPTYIFASPILKLLGQLDDIAELSRVVSVWFIPQHFAHVFTFSFQRYLQSQLKNMVTAWISIATLVLHIVLSWIFIIRFGMGLVGAAITLNLTTWVPPIAQFIYIVCGGYPQTWNGLSKHAFDDTSYQLVVLYENNAEVFYS